MTGKGTGAIPCDVIPTTPTPGKHAEVLTVLPLPQDHQCATQRACADAITAKDEPKQKCGWQNIRSAKSNLAGPKPKNLRKCLEVMKMKLELEKALNSKDAKRSSGQQANMTPPITSRKSMTVPSPLQLLPRSPVWH